MPGTLETSLLRTFVAIADLGSFARAATSVNLAQPTISLQMKRLEEQTGSRLFRRDGRSSAMTEEGLRLLAYARRILALHDETWTAIASPGVGGQLRFGMFPDLENELYTKLICVFARAHPDVRMEVFVGSSVELEAGLAEGRLDLAMMIGKESEATPLYRREPIAWIASDAFQLHDGAPIPLIFCQSPCRFREMGIAALDAGGVDWRVVLTSQSLIGTRAAVTAGVGVTLRGVSFLEEGLRILDAPLGAPMQSSFDIVLARSPAVTNHRAADAMSALVVELAHRGRNVVRQ
jgi:DNA-binding transcriptional LysR family regulator